MGGRKGVSIKKLPNVLLPTFFHFCSASGKFSNVCLKYAGLRGSYTKGRNYRVDKQENSFVLMVDSFDMHMQYKCHLKLGGKHSKSFGFPGLHLKDYTRGITSQGLQ